MSEIILKLGASDRETRIYSPEEKTLRDGQEGVIPLRRQSAEVLEALLRAEARIVGKRELIEQVWGKAAVTDDSISQCISDIRKGLADNEHAILVTHARKGYALRLPEKSTNEDGCPMNLGNLGTIPRIAILAFDDFSVGDDHGYLSDAISEGITAAMVRNNTIEVVARNSAFHYRGTHTDVRQIGQELGVHYVLEGSQQKSGGLLKVVVQLTETKNGSHIWANTYAVKIGDLFTVQDQIIHTVANRIGVKIQHPITTADENTVTALHLYLRVLADIRRDCGPETNARNKLLCQQAIEVDPGAPYGYIGMAWYYRNGAYFGWHGLKKDFALAKGFEAANRALGIAPDNPDIHYVLGCLNLESNETERARAALNKAIELNPSDASYLAGSATLYLLEGDVQTAIERLELAMGMDPYHLDWFHTYMAWAQWEMRDCDGALASMHKMARVQRRDLLLLSGIHACLGHVDEAQKAYQTFFADSAEPSITEHRKEWEKRWTAPGSLDRWLEHMRIAGMKD